MIKINKVARESPGLVINRLKTTIAPVCLQFTPFLVNKREMVKKTSSSQIGCTAFIKFLHFFAKSNRVA